MPLKKRSQREIVRDLHWRIGDLEAENKELKERLSRAEKTLLKIDSLHNDSDRESELVHEHFKLLKK